MISDNKENFADLHVHTIYSDGMFMPEEAVEAAVGLGLKAIAITDHDCIEGITPTIEAAKNTDLEIIPGVEISAYVKDVEIHLLGYFLDWKKPSLVERLNRMKNNRRKRMLKMIQRLQEQGLEISEEDVFETDLRGTVGRLHLAHVMMEKGLVSSTKEAFGRYIGEGKSCCVQHKRLDHTEAIDMVVRAGGVPVLGHPGVSGVDKYIPELVSAGIKGLEVYHTDHSSADTDRYLKLAEKYSLLVTGGSDCHGLKKGSILMGRVRVSRDTVEKIRKESEKIRAR